MRYMDLEGNIQKFNDVGGYRHNYKDFCENFIFPKSINGERMIIIDVPMQA